MTRDDRQQFLKSKQKFIDELIELIENMDFFYGKIINEYYEESDPDYEPLNKGGIEIIFIKKDNDYGKKFSIGVREFYGIRECNYREECFYFVGHGENKLSKNIIKTMIDLTNVVNVIDTLYYYWFELMFNPVDLEKISSRKSICIYV